KNLFRYEIDPDTCTGCEACRKKCPVEAISGEKKEVHVIDLDTCTQCGICYDTCRFGAIKKARVKEVAL
ncbi:MAG: indolepyruvate ferredoxin oxidoreductase subunit alpha, partial [Spirochaetota bacterium]